MSSTEDSPLVLTGGCLCAAIRYEVTFNRYIQWPPQSETCQCTMCRKWTGSLIYQYITISPDQVSPPLSASPSYREFRSSPDRYRGFCGQCGTSLTWRSDREGEVETCDLSLGTIDERWLMEKGEHGLAKVLSTPSGAQYWRCHAIEGVTDYPPGGTIYLAGNDDGPSTSK
ncbi:Mss4-like protein [Aspergillus keveii]|uniref:Mss4-like protein n=1 Tax=Aspergillus keveii TaxID=714993 RepID=A0ABR4FY88_9EURO